MTIIISLVVAIMFGSAIYMILQKSLIKMLFGFSLLTHAINILVLSVAGNPIGKKAPIILDGAQKIIDPLPQALILTAIVIGFGVTAFLIVFLYRLFLHSHTTNAEVILNHDD